MTLGQLGRTAMFQIEFDAYTDDLAAMLYERFEQHLRDLDRVPALQAILNEPLDSSGV